MNDDRLAFFEGASLPALATLLDDVDPAQRADAACALGDRLRLREVEALDAAIHDRLAALLDDAVPIVRFEAAVALAEVRDGRALSTLVDALEVRWLRLDAMRALGTLADERAVEPLLHIMDRWFAPWADRLQAAAALCAAGEARGAAYLKGRLASWRVAERAAALHFVGESRHPEAFLLLRAVVETPAHPLRDVAIRALGLLGDPAGCAVLEAARAGADAELSADIEDALLRLARHSEGG